MTVVLLGELGAHARGKTLTAAIGARAGDLPSRGLALAFAKEGQEHVDRLGTWAEWAREPGRVLVLVPPFLRGACVVPTAWEARRAEPLAGGETELGRSLARERQHDLRGDLVPAERVAGQVVTGLWRRHPTAGMFVVTTLPLWSLLVLEHRAALRTWLDELVGQAGEPRAHAEPDGPAAFQPSPADWTVLLHLCTGPYLDRPAALHALATSTVLRLDASTAGASLSRAELAGWAEGGSLTDAGREALNRGPYALQARALARMPHV